MGRLTPDAPLRAQGPPKAVPPRRETPTGYGPFKCGYCGRYGQPGACEGCGAPNAPAPMSRPAFPENRVVRCEESQRIDITVFGEWPRRYLEIPARRPDRIER